jgi:outer membrane protein TolC
MRDRVVAAVATLSALAISVGAIAQAPANRTGSLRAGVEATTKPGAAPPAREMSLAQSIETALRNSPSLQAAGREVIRARGSVHESKTAFLPTLSADLTITHLDQGVTAELGPGQSIAVVRQDQKSATVTAALPVDVFGMIRAASSVAEFQYVIARLDYNRQRNQLVQDATAAYYDALRAEAFVAVVAQADTNAQDRVRIAEAYLKAGAGTRFDVVRAQTELANAQQGVLSAKNSVALAHAALNNLMGLDQATPLSLAKPSDPSGVLPADLASALSEAYAARPEVLQAETGIKAAEKGLTLAKRSVLPTVGVAWNLQYTPDTGAFGRKSSWAAVARATVPLFDGGAAGARREQARAGVDAAILGRARALDGVALDVRQAHLSLADAVERLKVADAGLTQATEAYRLAQVRYKAGVTMTPGGSPLLEISDAQTALTQAQTNRINAQYDIEIARTRLMRAVGRYAYGPDAGPGLAAPPAALNGGPSK